MMMTRLLTALAFFLLLGGMADAQITVHNDSAAFDDAHGRLRDVDFEDVYSVTVRRMLFRNPWGLHCYGFESDEQSDSIDNYLLLGQGATIDFPTRTRTVEITGGASPFKVYVTDFNDSVYTIHPDSFPVLHTSPTGIRRMQFIGYDEYVENDINWRVGMTGVRIFDESGDTLAATDFEELTPERYYIFGKPLDATMADIDESLFGPNELHGITITEPTHGLFGTFLTEGWGRIDPDNPIGNLAVEMTADGTIDFREGVEGALLALESVHALDTIWLEVSDYGGDIDTVMTVGWGRPVDTNWMEDQRVSFLHIGFDSPAGIRQIKVLGAAYTGSIMLGAVHLAETPQSEIEAIGAGVAALDSAGLIDDRADAMLRARLAQAIAEVERRDNNGAISLLEQFRNDVIQLHASRALAPEEARAFLGDVGYVIARLGGEPSSVVERGASAGAHLDAPIVTRDGARLRYNLPSGKESPIGIYDLRGVMVRSIAVPSGSGSAFWDLRDASGAAVPNGTYLASLIVDGDVITRAMQVAR